MKPLSEQTVIKGDRDSMTVTELQSLYRRYRHVYFENRTSTGPDGEALDEDPHEQNARDVLRLLRLIRSQNPKWTNLEIWENEIFPDREFWEFIAIRHRLGIDTAMAYGEFWIQEKIHTRELDQMKGEIGIRSAFKYWLPKRLKYEQSQQQEDGAFSERTRAKAEW